MRRMTLRLSSLWALAAAGAALALGGCSSQYACNQSAVQQYPSVQLVSPANGSQNVPLLIGKVFVATSASSIVGSVTVTGPAGTWFLNLMPAGNMGSLSKFVAAIPPLTKASTYTVQYVITYPAGCQAAGITKTQTMGTFTSASS
jgi:hypothetical protein